MSQEIFGFILHKDGVADDTAKELVAAARKLDAGASVKAIVLGSGQGLETVCNSVSSFFNEVWKIGDDALSHPNAELIRALLVRILPKGCVFLLPHEHFGMDLAPGLSIKMDAAYLSDVTDFEGMQNGTIRAVRQEFSGQVSAHMDLKADDGSVITLRPGSFGADDVQQVSGQVVDKSAEALQGGLPRTNRRFIEVIEAEKGDVDITRAEILVSVGRGIGSDDNLEIIHDLAAAVGGEVSCSRPVVDANWLEKARQVGTSGQTVKPKVYMALGISGTFQHLAGIKGNPFMVAINKNPNAPIFRVADVGIVADILEMVPALTEVITDRKG